MSHFLVTVLLPKDTPEDSVESVIERALAPFDENLETPRYVRYTREELIAKGRKEIADYADGYYAEYLKDPAAYEEKCGRNQGHVKYVRDEFPKKLDFTDEKVYEDQTKYYEPNEIGPNGEIYSTRNPQSKWDWYAIGGRWDGALTGERHNDANNPFGSIEHSNIALTELLPEDYSSFAFITPEGEWIERGRMGWWAAVHGEVSEPKWKETCKMILAKYHDTLAVAVDCHI